MPFGTTFQPENLQFLGVARELVAGTPILPTATVAAEKFQPENKVTYLVDKSIVGNMAEDQADIQGVEIGDYPLSGNVYLDSIGHFLYNLFGDLQDTGTTPTSATTVALATSAGATSVTVGAIGSIVIGSVLQFGNALIGTAPTETLTVSNVAGSVVTFSTPCRFAHTAGAAIAIVTAPFTHVFSLLNSGNGQPPTHTLTHRDGLAGTFGARQYPYWCCSGMDFKISAEELFTHDTKGTSLVGVLASGAPTNSQSSVLAVPDWTFKVGVGGPASGGTQINNVESADISLMRGLKPKFTLQGSQAPFLIARLALGATGKFTVTALDESPLLSLLNDTQQQLQFTMTQGAGPSQVGITFDFQTCKYESVPIQAPDLLCYDVSFRAYANATNAGASGAKSPAKVTLVNAVGSY